MKISVCCPSYKRPNVETLRYIPFCKVYVDGKEAEEYKRQNKGAEIVVCPDGVQGNVSRVRNYIMRNEFEQGADAVAMVDDDMEGMYLWIGQENHSIVKEKINTDALLDLIEKYSIVCRDLGFFYWGVNVNYDPLTYTTYKPFNFSGFIGGPFQVFLKGNDCWYDERISLKEDYDMALQQCNKHRGLLRCNFICYNVKQSENKGGCATYRNLLREKEQFEILRKKWGPDIVHEDTSNKGRTKKQKRFDYNPIIKIPIPGI